MKVRGQLYLNLGTVPPNIHHWHRARVGGDSANELGFKGVAETPGIRFLLRAIPEKRGGTHRFLDPHEMVYFY